MSINLFSTSLQRKMIIARRARHAGKLWGATFVVAVVIASARWPQTRVVSKELELAERLSAPIAEKISQSEKLRADLVRLTESLKKLQPLAPDTAPIGALGLLAAATSAADDIQIRSVSYTATKHPLLSAKNPTTMARGGLVVHGLCAGEAAVARFVEHLRNSSCFEHVELKSSSRTSAMEPTIQFDVVCHL